MHFVAETSGEIHCRLMCSEHFGGKLIQYKELPFSKLFGFITEHIFETIRDVNGNFERDDRTMKDILKAYPIEYSFLYKNNKDYNQGISADISDYQVVKGGGEGSKPSSLNRIFNKQLIIIFKFVNDPPWINEFKKVWMNRQILLHGTMDTKKSIAKDLWDISFDYDKSKVYYTYDKFVKTADVRLNTHKMLFMFNHRNIKESIYIEELNENQFNMVWDKDGLIDELVFHKTSTIIGD